MFGPPKDVPGECNHRMVFGDDYGDGSVTFRCSLPDGHTGRHREMFFDETYGNVLIKWSDPKRFKRRDKKELKKLNESF